MDQLTPQKPGTAAVVNASSVQAAMADLSPAAPAEPVTQVAAKPQADAPLPAKPLPAGAELRAAVLALLRDAAVGPEGLHLDVIGQKVGSAGDEVRSMITE